MVLQKWKGYFKNVLLERSLRLLPANWLKAFRNLKAQLSSWAGVEATLTRTSTGMQKSTCIHLNISI
eukprot:scaffold331352_cov15-Prasinocladus_malaysianus.AAC.1